MNALQTLSSTILIMLLCLGSAQAEENTDNLTDMWVVEVNVNDRQAFESALKKHMQFRVNAGDPKEWNVYTQVIGEQMNQYTLRACCTNWDKIADYNAWASKSNTGKHWAQTVRKYTIAVNHYYSEVDSDNSAWDNSKNFKYFSVDTLTPKAGEGFAVRASIKKISDAAKNMQWPESWVWHNRIGGAAQISLVVGHESYADMMPAVKSFFVQLSEQMKDKAKAQSLLETYGKHFAKSEYAVYVHRVDLSSPKSKTSK
ncbi:hypothetical protein AADZ86_05160 [Colwelliaceae bacterium BS250]